MDQSPGVLTADNSKLLLERIPVGFSAVYNWCCMSGWNGALHRTGGRLVVLDFGSQKPAMPCLEASLATISAGLVGTSVCMLTSLSWTVCASCSHPIKIILHGWPPKKALSIEGSNWLWFWASQSLVSHSFMIFCSLTTFILHVGRISLVGSQLPVYDYVNDCLLTTISMFYRCNALKVFWRGPRMMSSFSPEKDEEEYKYNHSGKL